MINRNEKSATNQIDLAMLKLLIGKDGTGFNGSRDSHERMMNKETGKMVDNWIEEVSTVASEQMKVNSIENIMSIYNVKNFLAVVNSPNRNNEAVLETLVCYKNEDGFEKSSLIAVRREAINKLKGVLSLTNEEISSLGFMLIDQGDIVKSNGKLYTVCKRNDWDEASNRIKVQSNTVSYFTGNIDSFNIAIENLDLILRKLIEKNIKCKKKYLRDFVIVKK